MWSQVVNKAIAQDGITVPSKKSVPMSCSTEKQLIMWEAFILSEK